jgi:hypothetical protein
LTFRLITFSEIREAPLRADIADTLTGGSKLAQLIFFLEL